tara:strand:- start:824 stop:1657 length:834 start_codon:yes stop_codon:yes gene_type:complete
MGIKQSKIAFVTGYIGQSPTNIPNISKNVDSYFITNNKEISDELIKKNIFTKVITIDNIPVINSNDSVVNYVSNTMNGKMLKVFPQIFLEKQYDFVIWYDNKYSVNVNDTIRAINSWDNSLSLMLPTHPFDRVNNVKEEFDESMGQPRYVYEKDKYIKYINDCKKKGLSDEYKFHSTCTYIIYNLNHKMTRKIQEEWMNNIKECGIQDQISFNMFRQDYEKYIGEYKYNYRNENENEPVASEMVVTKNNILNIAILVIAAIIVITAILSKNFKKTNK